MLYASQNHERACTLGVHEELFGQVCEVSGLARALSRAFLRLLEVGLIKARGHSKGQNQRRISVTDIKIQHGVML